ncbi:MAG: hypothetical protein J6W17_01090, partial [Campylobacter sp.]|nr:hypothetical protein [Campylobacter sp.]
MKNRIIIVLVFICLAVSIFYGMKYLILLNQVSSLINSSEQVRRIVQTNSHINEYFNNKFGNVNFDEINKNIEIFDENIKQILNSDAMRSSEFAANLLEADKLFKQKLKLINEFNHINSQSLISIKNLERLFPNMVNKENYIKLYTQISSLNYRNEDEITNARREFEKLRPSDESESNFIAISYMLLENFERLNKINNQKNTEIDAKIFELHNNFSNFANKYYTELKYITMAFFALFIASFCIILLAEIFSFRQSALYKAFKEVADKSFCSIAILDRTFRFKFI